MCSPVDRGRLQTLKQKSPKDQLAGFLAKYTPEVASQARAALALMRSRLPGAIELVYDNYNALAVGFGPTERASDVIFSIAVWPRWISLFFLQNGPDLPDPKKLLKGSGTRVRHIVLKEPKMLDLPAIRTLMNQALQRASKPLDPDQPRRIVIKSVSKKQRPRRPAP